MKCFDRIQYTPFYLMGGLFANLGDIFLRDKNFHTANLRQPQKQRLVFFIQHIYPKYTIAPFKPIFKNPF